MNNKQKQFQLEIKEFEKLINEFAKNNGIKSNFLAIDCQGHITVKNSVSNFADGDINSGARKELYFDFDTVRLSRRLKSKGVSITGSGYSSCFNIKSIAPFYDYDNSDFTRALDTLRA